MSLARQVNVGCHSDTIRWCQNRNSFFEASPDLVPINGDVMARAIFGLTYISWSAAHIFRLLCGSFHFAELRSRPDMSYYRSSTNLWPNGDGTFDLRWTITTASAAVASALLAILISFTITRMAALINGILYVFVLYYR